MNYLPMNTKKLFAIVSALAFTILLSSCGDDAVESQPFKQSINFNMDNLGNLNTLVENPNAHSGKKICHLDSGITYGFYYTFNIPDSLAGRTISCSIDAWARTGKLDNDCTIACSVASEKDSSLAWTTVEALPFIKAPNEWTNINGSFVFPGNIIVFGGKINILCINSKASSYFDIDDLKVSFTEEREQAD
jgi:hypothetical protein